jgi:hypothetical protein
MLAWLAVAIAFAQGQGAKGTILVNGADDKIVFERGGNSVELSKDATLQKLHVNGIVSTTSLEVTGAAAQIVLDKSGPSETVLTTALLGQLLDEVQKDYMMCVSSTAPQSLPVGSPLEVFEFETSCDVPILSPNTAITFDGTEFTVQGGSFGRTFEATSALRFRWNGVTSADNLFVDYRFQYWDGSAWVNRGNKGTTVPVQRGLGSASYVNFAPQANAIFSVAAGSFLRFRLVTWGVIAGCTSITVDPWGDQGWISVRKL